MRTPRVAFFTDSFHEVNGVALTSRQFAEFAREREYPFLSVHVGPKTAHLAGGSFETLELANSRAVLNLDTNLHFDLLFLRHYWRVKKVLQSFQPDIIHVTGPGHLGILGAMGAYALRVPMAASWHTNLHEFARQRLERLMRLWPARLRSKLAHIAEAGSLSITAHFYKWARVLFAPNPELVNMLATRTGRPTHLMLRGIDLDLYSPDRRERTDEEFVIGCVGRLSPEKNIRLLATLERLLRQAGLSNYRFLVVGDGSDRRWLAGHMSRCDLPGILRGPALARAYANMDVFVFPSETDTFGNVVVEAMASAVPAIVTNAGGPKYLVEPGVSGIVARNPDAFVSSILELQRNPELRSRMSLNARKRALQFSWSSVFEKIYREYEAAFGAEFNGGHGSAGVSIPAVI
jgi:glycosyltransferase involved in cell wall biosynthesis